MKKQKIHVKGTEIVLFQQNEQDYISLTDIARHKNAERSDDVVKNWMRNKNTLEFLGLWEKLNNPDFKPVEFDGFRSQAGLNAFVMTPKRWIEGVNAIGIVSKSGRNGGTFAHKDIAFEFASWISVEFKLFLIKEFQRLKEEENERLELGWDLKRNLAKINYQVHTDAVKKHLIPDKITKKQASLVYASEADVLNMALFGMIAKDWRTENPKAGGNIRDHATAAQLVCLTNLESLNAELIRQGLEQSERLLKLNEIAIIQMKSLAASPGMKRLK